MGKFAILRTLKFRITAMVVTIGVLAALGTAQLVLQVTQADLRQMLLNAERDNRERTAALLGSKLNTLRHVLTRVAQHSSSVDWRDSGALAQLLMGETALASLFDGAFAVAPSGRMLARVDQKAGSTQDLPNVGDRDYFHAAMHSDQPVVSAPLRSRTLNAPLLVIAAPVLDAQGQHRGLLAGGLLLESSSLFAQLNIKASTDGVIDLVMDKQGRILAHPDSGRLLGLAADEPGLREVVARWQAEGSPAEPEGRAEWSEGYLVAMAGIPLSDWVHVRLTPEASALLPVHDARRSAWIAAALAALLAGGLAGAGSWRMVRPISRLQRRAEAMLVNGDDSAERWPVGHGEVGAMARAFQQLLQQRAQRQQEVNELLQQLEAVVDHAEVGIALTRHGRLEVVSRRFCQIFRAEREQLVGQRTRVLYADDAAHAEQRARIGPAFASHGSFEGEVRLQRMDGEGFWARMRGRVVQPGNRGAGTIWVVDDVTQARHHREQLTWAASHDALTGLANRGAFEAALETLTQEAGHAPFCALFIDLDRFKQVNDSGGHAAGDTLLRGIAQVLAAPLRRSDLAARLGGDEFAVLLPHCPVERAQAIAETLRADVGRYALSWEGASHSVGCSMGLVLVNGRHVSAAEVLRDADSACYRAKREGRNKVVLAGD